MEERPSLTKVFVEHASVRVGVPEDAVDFEAQLRCAWEVGRERWWPRIALPADVFIRYLAQRLPGNREGILLEQALALLSLGDLYLACACVQGMPAAIAMLEIHYMAKLPAVLASPQLSSMVVDDVRQLVRIHLLVGSSESGPQIARYTGHGALLSWIRVIAVRMAVKQSGPFRETVLEGNLLAALEDMAVPGDDTDLELIKRRYRREFRQALYEAFAELSSEQRYQLRLYFVEKLSTVDMGAMFYVNQSTVSRWLKNARRAVHQGTKRRLQERLGLSSKEFTSLLNAIESQLDLSVSQVFKEQD